MKPAVGTRLTWGDAWWTLRDIYDETVLLVKDGDEEEVEYPLDQLYTARTTKLPLPDCPNCESHPRMADDYLCEGCRYGT